MSLMYFLRGLTKDKLLFLLLLLIVSACQSADNREVFPSLPASPASVPSVTSSPPSPISTIAASLTPEGSSRSCSADDFKTPAVPPSIDQPETLIGFQPARNWVPGENWQETHGIYYDDVDFIVQAYKNVDQHLFVLEKPICMYEDGRYPLNEIKDYLLIQGLHENELIVDSPSFLASPALGEHISQRLNFKWEMHTNVECSNAPQRAIMLATYNLDELPDKIEPGTQLPVAVIHGWLPDPSSNTFVEFSETQISCIIMFAGY